MPRLTPKVLVVVPMAALFLMGCSDTLGEGADLVAPDYPGHAGACAPGALRATQCGPVSLHATPEGVVVATA